MQRQLMDFCFLTSLNSKEHGNLAYSCLVCALPIFDLQHPWMLPVNAATVELTHAMLGLQSVTQASSLMNEGHCYTTHDDMTFAAC